MCGIAGIVDLKARPVERALLKQMCDALVHRGPDDEGYYVDSSVSLGQRRLSIIDRAGGRQPLSNEDGSVWITFNGAVYGFRALRDQLAALGHRFATRSDTEVIVHAYEQYGPECVKHLRGMFAFALWDKNRQTLMLARDRVGKKPVFYTEAGGQFVFASELQAIVQHPGVCRELNLTAIDDYLTYGYIPAPGTIFKGIHKLLPAHYLTLGLNEGGPGVRECKVERYWQLEYLPKLELDEAQAGEALLEILTEAVRLRLIADVPLGALLSGGVDSSMVVALMSRLSDQPVKTFSIGFDDKEFNELPYARLVARRYGTDHRELVVRPDALEVLPALIRHYGEPYADSSAIPTYYVARLTRQHVTVALNGDGGDESFAGYDRYLGSDLANHYHRIPRPLRRHVIEPVSSLVPDSLPRNHKLRRAQRFFQVAGQPFAQRYLGWVSYFKPEQKQSLYSASFQSRLVGHDAPGWLLRQFAAAEQAALNPVDSVLAVDVQSYLPYDLLVKMDIATMANSLEARAPFLDHKLMEFCARLPSNYKLRGTTSKYLLKKVASKLLPPENLKRRKMGFGVPVGQWMRNELRPLLEDSLLSERAEARGYFEPKAVRRLAQEHIEGAQDHSSKLWALLCLELWHQEFVD